MATWLVIEKRSGQDTYDVERNGRAFAYDLDLCQAQDRIAKNRRFDRSADRVVLVRTDGGRETIAPRRRS